MSSRLSDSGQTTALVLVGLMLLAIPAGLAVAQGLSTTDAEQQTIPTVTPPSLVTPTPTATATPTPTSTPTPSGDDNNTDGDSTTGQTHFVNAGVGPADSVTSEEGCSGANYSTIQAAVDDAESRDTVAVCPGTYSEHIKVTTSNLTITVADRVTQAAGDVTITNVNESAVWINAPSVTLQGFNISVGEDATYAIEVGGQGAVIRDNTVDAPNVGIFLSDGRTETGECRVDDRKGDRYDIYTCDPHPPVDPDLGAATQGRVQNNTVSASVIRIWVDADQTVVQNNFVTSFESPEEAPNYAECRTKTTDEPQKPCRNRFNDSIVSSGNDTIIRGNVIRIDKTPTGIAHTQAGIMLGKTPTQGHNMATNNTVVGNYINNPIGVAVKTRNVSAGAVIKDNSVASTANGMRISDAAIIRNNDVSIASEKCSINAIWIPSFEIAEVQNYEEKKVLVINNTLAGHNNCWNGLNVRHDTVIKGNRIRNFIFRGIKFDTCDGGEGRVVGNRITGNDMSGILARGGHGFSPPCNKGKIEIVNNQITNNENGIKIEVCVYPEVSTVGTA